MKYFKNCRTAEDVKKTFKDLVKKMHPDCGGNEEAFKEMMVEYERVFETLKNTHKTAEGKTYESQKATTETAQKFADRIINIIHLESIKIEIIGTWIWVSGDTYPHRTILRASGYEWSKSKKAWYHTGVKLEGKKRGHYNMNQLRNMFGSEEIETEKQEKIAG